MGPAVASATAFEHNKAFLRKVALFESMLESVILARDAWLKPGGHLIPSRARLFLAPLRDDEAIDEREHFLNRLHVLLTRAPLTPEPPLLDQVRAELPGAVGVALQQLPRAVADDDRVRRSDRPRAEGPLEESQRDHLVEDESEEGLDLWPRHSSCPSSTGRA